MCFLTELCLLRPIILSVSQITREDCDGHDGLRDAEGTFQKHRWGRRSWRKKRRSEKWRCDPFQVRELLVNRLEFCRGHLRFLRENRVENARWVSLIAVSAGVKESPGY